MRLLARRDYFNGMMPISPWAKWGDVYLAVESFYEEGSVWPRAFGVVLT